MNEMTHRIQNSSPGGLRPSTLPLGHGGSRQYWISHVDEEDTFCFFQIAKNDDCKSNKPFGLYDLYTNISGLYPANTKHLYNICTTSTWRLRRRSNIVQKFKCKTTVRVTGYVVKSLWSEVIPTELTKWNEMNRALDHFCAHTACTG